jgi:hypothetical protein
MKRIDETGITEKVCLGCNRMLPLDKYYFRKTGYGIVHRARCIECYAGDASEHLQKPGVKKAHAKYLRDWNHRTGRTTPINEAKDSSVYLGYFVAERVLSTMFGNIQRMPYGNPKFDFLCAKNKKIDVKSACRLGREKHSARWMFNIKMNCDADYFLCLAFNNREDLDPQYVWLIPGHLVNSKKHLYIIDSPESIDRWNAYGKPIDKVVECCNKMKGVA